MSRLVIIGGSDAGISAALRASMVVAVRAVRVSYSLPGATTNRSRSPAFFMEAHECDANLHLLEHRPLRR
jgi:hypothetical protein